jgi:alkylation response protein AidB-like acyl-CoA dehydrogenase
VAEYRFTDEQNQLRDAVRKFSAEHFAEGKTRQLMESDPPFDPKVWARLGGELGVLGLSIPEADSGVGGTLVDQAVAIEELGARLACGPLFGTVYLAIPALVAASPGRVRDELLGDLIEGRRTAAVVVVDRAGVFDPEAVTVTVDGDAVSGAVTKGSTAASLTCCWSPRADRTVWPSTPSTPGGWRAARRWPRSTSPDPRRTSHSPTPRRR